MAARWAPRLSILLALCVANRAGADAIIIPIEVVQGNNIAIVSVSGRKIRAHIDTGGFGTIGITSTALSGLALRFSSETATRTDGSGAKFSGRTFVIPELDVAGHVLKNVAGFERKQAVGGGFGGAEEFDAVIGRGFLAPYTVVVDYPRKRIELHPFNDGPRVCGAQTAPLRVTPEGFWTSMVRTDHGAFELIWDTGARGASFIQERLVADRKLPVKDDAYPSATFVIGSRDLGPVELVPIPLTGYPGFDGLIGINVFATHRVCFDGKRGTVSIS